MTVDLVVNRRARDLSPASGLRAKLVGVATGLGVRVHETESLEDLAQVARLLASRGTDAVVLAGGDGSHMEGVSALARAFGEAALPRVGFAAGGTVGTIARNLGMRGGAEERSERLLRAVAAGSGRPVRAPTLRVRDDVGGDRVGFMFGIGLVTRFFDVYESVPRKGLGPAAAIAARVLVGAVAGGSLARRVLAPVACAIDVDGTTRPSRAWSLVLASVLRDVGLGIRATYRAGEREDRFHVIASTLTAKALAAQVPRVLGGRPMGGRDAVDVLARSLRVSLEEPGGYVLDGDAMRVGEATVTAGPVLRVLLP